MRILFFIFLLCLFPVFSIAQNKRVLDSLNSIYATSKDDTVKIGVLLDIATQYIKSNTDTCIVLSKQGYLLSERIKYLRGMSQSCHLQGLAYYSRGNFPVALNWYQKSLQIQEEVKDKKSILATLNNIGLIYTKQKEYNLALEYYTKCLKITEELKDKKGLSGLYNNIGVIYLNFGKLDEGLSYYQKSLVLKEELKDKKGISITYNNIADIYLKKNNLLLALQYYQQSLKIKEELNDKAGMLYCLQGINNCYRNLGNYDESILYAEKGLKLALEMKVLYEIQFLYECLYLSHKAKKDNTKALEYHELSKQMNDSIFNVEKSKSIANLESKMALEKKEKEFVLLAKDNELNKLAAEKQAHELEITKRQAEAEQLLSLARAEKDKRKQDSLYNLAQQAKLEAENLKTKEEKNKLEAEKERLAHLAELEQQKRIRNTFLGLAVTAFLVIVLVAVGYYQKQKSNRLLAQQNDAIKSQNQEIKRQQTEIAQKNDKLSQANAELHQQQEELVILNENLELQKEEIQATYAQLKTTSDALGKSISYASDIQNIILADTEQLHSFFTDVFILYKPKDIVSGDFYWFSKISDEQSVFVLADCTGHGVPGAFMSMLGSTLLDEAVNERKLYRSPADILKFLHQRLRKMLKQEEGKNTDGMDISIVYFEKEKTQTNLRFAGAKSHMYYVLNNQINSLDGDRIYLGGRKPTAEFTNKEVTVTEDTIFYFFSDGFADQNNAERQKFGAKNLQNVLFSVHHLPLAAQKGILEQKLMAHQGEEHQRDDISVVGLKI